MSLKNILNKECVLVNVEAKNKKELFKVLSNKLYQENIISDVDKFIIDLELREEEYSTGIGYGLAIPHAKSEHVKKAAILVAKLANQLDYSTIDSEDVKMVFLLATPLKSSEEHLEMLGNLCRRLVNIEFRNKLLNAQTSEEIYNILIEK